MTAEAPLEKDLPLNHRIPGDILYLLEEGCGKSDFIETAETLLHENPVRPIQQKIGEFFFPHPPSQTQRDDLYLLQCSLVGVIITGSRLFEQRQKAHEKLTQQDFREILGYDNGLTTILDLMKGNKVSDISRQKRDILQSYIAVNRLSHGQFEQLAKMHQSVRRPTRYTKGALAVKTVQSLFRKRSD